MFDALGAAGGVQAILLSFSYFLNAILSHNKSDNFVASRLYKDSDVPLKAQNQSSIKEWLHSILPLCCMKNCKCLKRNR